MRTRPLGGGSNSLRADPRFHLTASLQLSPACEWGIGVTIIPSSSEALAGLWSPRGLPNYSGRSPRAISRVPPSRFLQGVCPHLPCPRLPPRPLPHMRTYVAATSCYTSGRQSRLTAHRLRGRPCPARQGHYSFLSFHVRAPSLCCPDHESLGLQEEGRTVHPSPGLPLLTSQQNHNKSCPSQLLGFPWALLNSRSF